MTKDEFIQLRNHSAHFLGSHHPRSAAERLREIAESPLAEIRPDGYGNGGYVNELESEIASLLGKEAAVFMPSGTMAQPIALRIWADRVGNPRTAFHPTCHLELHEHRGYQELHHLSATLLGEPDRLFTVDDLQKVGSVLSSILIELPQREIGGQLPTWEELTAIITFAQENKIRLHLDGARLWECQPYYGKSYQDIAAGFDSVYVSFYKILGGLPGAVLAGPSDFIAESKIWMRRQGGNLVHMFPNAISAKIGLDRHLPEIPKYVAKAKMIARVLNTLPGITTVPSTPETNMMHIHFTATAEEVMSAVAETAKAEDCFLFPFVSPTERGSKVELSIGDAALCLSEEKITDLLTAFANTLNHKNPTYR